MREIQLFRRLFRGFGFFLGLAYQLVVQPGENRPTDKSLHQPVSQPDNAPQRADTVAPVAIAERAHFSDRALKSYHPPGVQEHTQAQEDSAGERKGLDIQLHLALHVLELISLQALQPVREK